MDIQTFQQISSIASSLTVSGLLLYFVFYFRQKSEDASKALIDHLENDLQRSREEQSKV